MKKRITTIGATVVLVMSMGTAAMAAQPVDPGSNLPNDPQLHAGHWGYVQSFANSGNRAQGVPANVFHDNLPGYATGVGGWADYVKQGGPFNR